MAPRNRFRKTKPRRKTAAKKTARLSKPMKKAVKQLVRGEAETKRTAFYQDANNGSSGAIATGMFSTRGWAVQNNVITNNTTDLLQIIPYVIQGTNDFNRIGKSIRVVNLNVRGTVRILGSLIAAIGTPMTNLDVYVYVLQHVSLKNYTDLRARNDFSRLLEDGEGGGRNFLGNALDPFMPVSKQTYNVLARKRIQLKYGGAALPGGTLTTPVSVANAHQWSAEYNINLTKKCPKKLTFPDDDNGSILPTIYNSPTNSSIFMVFGFVDEQVGNPAGSLVRPWLEQTYVSSLTFKDM